MTQDVLKRCLQFHLSMNTCRRRLWQTDSKEAVWKVQSETDCRIFKTVRISNNVNHNLTESFIPRVEQPSTVIYLTLRLYFSPPIW